MKRSLAFLVFLATLALPGCVTHYEQLYVGSDDYVLATHEGPDGAKERYELVVRSTGGDANLRVISEHDRERPFLGFQPLELDKQAAEKRGVRPYTGLLVKGVYPSSSAQSAGVLAGDILLSIDGKETVYLPQLADIESRLGTDQQVLAKVLRGQNEMDLTLSAHKLHERITDNQDIALEAPKPSRPYAGVVLRGIPTVWTEKIYGTTRNAVVVTNVEVGSPAWTAGIRGGDVIETVDGAPVPSAQDLARAIEARGEQEQTMRWRVTRGPGEAFDAEIHLYDYSGETRFWFPFVFGFKNSAYEDRWSVGPFGLVMSNHNNYVAKSSTRKVETRNVFNALLGLIHVETGPDETEVRLLWFISFNT